MKIERTPSDFYARFGQTSNLRSSNSTNATAADAEGADDVNGSVDLDSAYLPVRADVVARGRELASDDSYPPFAVIEKVADHFLNSVDERG
ncbi:MAG TPA: hypothetical protein VFT72_06620 [Opitutaceae bacterium]|nr:hypothetical protein [Opitutaceae bacterium]